MVILFLVLEGRRDRVFQFLQSCLVKGAQLFNEISVINAKQIANQSPSIHDVKGNSGIFAACNVCSNCKSVVLEVTVIFSVAMGVRILFLSVVVLILFLRNSSSQSCHDDNGLEQQMSKEGYSGCPWVNHMYVRGFKKKSSPNDLRGFKAAKCCVPSSVYLWKPNVCTSADWDLSFRKWVPFSYNIATVSPSSL